jgi:hypothetical protein|tara:strand:+ start:4053 stop:4469 length:417 start_codon:yes stop_codon:yes gene_type:complete
MEPIVILKPLFVLALWTFMLAIMLASSRFYLMRKMHSQTAAHTKDLKGLLPPWCERLADNYNNLFEQPVIFYVAAISIAVINSFDLLVVQLAWSFVFLRIAHSLVQITFNFVLLRFLLFVSGWVILGLMICLQLFNFA